MPLNTITAVYLIPNSPNYDSQSKQKVSKAKTSWELTCVPCSPLLDLLFQRPSAYEGEFISQSDGQRGDLISQQASLWSFKPWHRPSTEKARSPSSLQKGQGTVFKRMSGVLLLPLRRDGARCSLDADIPRTPLPERASHLQQEITHRYTLQNWHVHFLKKNNSLKVSPPHC